MEAATRNLFGTENNLYTDDLIFPANVGTSVHGIEKASRIKRLRL